MTEGEKGKNIERVLSQNKNQILSSRWKGRYHQKIDNAIEKFDFGLDKR